MKKFTFENKVEPIEICGKEYTLDTGNVDFIKKALSKGEEIQAKLQKMTDEDLTTEKIDKLVVLLKGAFDMFLGDGEGEKIYESPECNKNVRYLTQLCNFIMDEIKIQAGQ